MGEEVPMLMDRTALRGRIGPERGERLLQPWRAVNNNERGRPQTARRKVIEERAPGRLALAAHVLHRQQHLLPVLAHAQHHKKRDRGRLAVEATAYDGAVEDKANDRLSRQVAPV